jgi:hypothetical protein
MPLPEKSRTIERMLVLLSLSTLVLILFRKSTVADPDLWGYMTFGRLFWNSSSFPYKDIFTYLPTHDKWIYHEWLMGVALYPIYTCMGGSALVVLRDLMAIGTLCFLYLSARTRQSSRASALFWILLVSGFLQMGYGTILRAQTVTYLLTALTIYLLERSRRKMEWSLLFILIPIQILWCNIHGGFLAFFGIVAMYALGEALSGRVWWPYLLLLLVSALSTIVNPYGIDYWVYLFQAVTMARGSITEWVSVLNAYTYGISLSTIFYYMLVVVLSLRILIWARMRDITPILLLSVTLLLGMRHVRHMVFFLMLAAVYLPELFERYIEDFKTTHWARIALQIRTRVPTLLTAAKRVSAPLCVLLLVLFSCILLASSSLSLTIPSAGQGYITYYPKGSLEYIRRNRLSGNLLTEFGWGEYLIWNLSPEIKVALDGRYETVYQDRVANDYFDYMNGKENGFLDAYPHDFVLLNPDSPPVTSLHKNPDWVRVYEDRTSILFAKR